MGAFEAAPDDREQAERGDELAEHLSGAGPDVLGELEQRLAEHQVRDEDAGDRAGNLSGDVRSDEPPWRCRPAWHPRA